MSLTRHEVILWAQARAEELRETKQLAQIGRSPTGGRPTRYVPLAEFYEFVIRALREGDA